MTCAPNDDSDQPGHSLSTIKSSLSLWRMFGCLATHKMHSEDNDQTAQQHRLIWDFTEQTLFYRFGSNLSHLMRKPIKWPVHPAKTKISLGICPVWSESLLCAQRIAKDRSFLHADSDDSDQTGQMPRLIWVFAERTCHFVGFVMWWLILNVIPLMIYKQMLDVSDGIVLWIIT